MPMTNDDKIPFTLRIRKPIADKLSQAADEMGVSKNAFIIMALNEKLRTPDAKGLGHGER